MLEVYSSPIFSATAQTFLDITRRVLCRIINYAFYSTKGSFWEIFLVEICAPRSRISSDHRCRFTAQNFSVGLSNLNPNVSRWSYFRKKFVGIFINFYIFGLWEVTSQTFDKKIMIGWPKLPSTVSEIFNGEKLSHQKNFFPSVSDFELMIFGLLVKKFGKLTKTALYVSRRDFRRIKSFKLKSFFIITSWICADDLQDSGEKCRKNHQSCFQPVQTNILPKNVMEKKNSTLSAFRKETSEVWREIELSEGPNFA